MILAVDVGTSGVRVALVDERGSLVEIYSRNTPLHTPTEFAAEHLLELIWSTISSGIASLAKRYRGRIAVVSLSTYLHGVGVLDSSHNVIVNSMTHLDRRCRAEQRAIEDYGYELYSRTGCPPIFTFPLCKALWLRKRNLLRHGHRLTFVKDYIVYRLSGHYTTDLGVASGTGFLNIHQLKWDSRALEIAGVDESMLPELYEGSRVFDYVTSRDLGLERVALVLGSFDGALQNIGYGVYGERAVLNIGSTAVIRTLTLDPVIDRSPEMRFFTYYAAEGYRVVGGASNNGMTAVDWMKSVAGVDRPSPPGGAVCSDGVFVLPFVAGERYPFRNPDLTLTATGLQLKHGREHLFKALIEGIGFTIRYILTALEENGVSISYLHCGGGGCSDAGIVEILANVLCRPVAVYRDPRSATILGAAVVGLKALGFTSPGAASPLREVLDYIHPSRELCNIYSTCAEKFLHLVRVIQSFVEGLH